MDETVARDILRAGLQEISVSVDYPDPARHDAQRGCPGLWERAVRALELFHKNRPDRRNRVHMISVLMDDNLDDVEPLIQLSREIGVTYMVNLYSWNRGTKARRLPDRSVTEHLLGLKRKYPEFVTLTTLHRAARPGDRRGRHRQLPDGPAADEHRPPRQCRPLHRTLDEPVGNILTDDVRDDSPPAVARGGHARVCPVLDLLPRLRREHAHAAAAAAVPRVPALRKTSRIGSTP